MAIIYAVILEIAKKGKRKKKWQRYITIYDRALIFARRAGERASVANHFAATADALSELLSTSKRFSILFCLRPGCARMCVCVHASPLPFFDRAVVFHARGRSKGGWLPSLFSFFRNLHTPIPPISDIAA